MEAEFIAGVMARLETIDSRTHSMNERLQSLGAQWAASEKNRRFIDQFRDAFGAPEVLSRRLDSVDTRIDKIEARVAKLEHAYTASRARIGLISAGLGAAGAAGAMLVKFFATGS